MAGLFMLLAAMVNVGGWMSGDEVGVSEMRSSWYGLGCRGYPRLEDVREVG